MALDTIGSIATHILENFDNVPLGVSGNMSEIVDMSRQYVANYVGKEIGSNSISAIYQPTILCFAKADTIDFVNAQGGGDKLKLGELSLDESGDQMSADAWRLMGEGQLKSMGRKVHFARSLS